MKDRLRQNAINRAWYHRNKQKRDEAIKKWQEKNKDKFRLICKNWRSNNRDKVRAYNRAWTKRNLSYFASRESDRRARKKGQGNQAEILKVYNRAKYFRQWFDVVVDHIMPLARGGLHNENNLQIIYRHENHKKKDRLDYHPSVVFR